MPLLTALKHSNCRMNNTDNDLFGDEQTVEEQVFSCIAVRLGTEWYGVPLIFVQEVVRLGPRAFLPSAPSGVTGIMSLRGSICSITDMKLFCGLPASAGDERQRVVIVQLQSLRTGLLVDEVLEMAAIPVSHLELPLPTLGAEQKPFITHVARWRERLIAVLDIEKILRGDKQ